MNQIHAKPNKENSWYGRFLRISDEESDPKTVAKRAL